MVFLSGLLVPLVTENRLDELEKYLKESIDDYSTSCCMEEACKTANYEALDLMLRYGVNPTYPYLDSWKNAKEIGVLERLLPATIPFLDKVLEHSRQSALDIMLRKTVDLNAEKIIDSVLELGGKFTHWDMFTALNNGNLDLVKKITEFVTIEKFVVSKAVGNKNIEALLFFESKGITLQNEELFNGSVSNSVELFELMLNRGNVVDEEIIGKACYYPQILAYLFHKDLFLKELQPKWLLKTIHDYQNQCVEEEIIDIFIDNCEVNTTHGAALFMLINSHNKEHAKKMIQKGEEVLPGHLFLAETLKMSLE